MPKEKPLVIYAPRQGISASPHTGYSDMRNLDIFSIPGVVKLNNILAKVSTTAVTATVKWIVRDPVTVANFYAVDSAGDVYLSTNSGATFADLGTQPTSGGAGQGLIIWKDYLFCARATAMDVYGPLSSSPSWSNSWAGLTMATDSLWHSMIVSKLDGKIYGGAGRYVFSIEEVSGQNFAPGTGGTYTATAQALDLPEDYRVKCLAEQGNNLMIGTWKGTNVYDLKIADIFPWDRSSASFGQPVQMVENGVNAMINDNGYLIILAGIEGAVYKSNGVQANKIAQIPLTLSDISNKKYLEPYPGALIKYKGRPFFGLSSSTTATRIVSDGVGVYSLVETSKGTVVNFEHSISEEVMGSANPTVIGALLPITRDQLLVGWRNHATYGIDLTTPASYLHTTAYTKAYFDSPLYQVGTNLNPRTFTQLEFLLARPLRTGEGIQIKYRTDLTSSFTTIGTYTFTSLGAIISHNTTADIPSCEMIQIRCEILGSSTTTPEYKQLELK